jgi:hypothetical protein
VECAALSSIHAVLKTRNSSNNPQGDLKMEPNLDRETVAMDAASMQVDDSVKSRVLERIKDQMAQDSADTGRLYPPPIYRKMPDDWA